MASCPLSTLLALGVNPLALNLLDVLADSCGKTEPEMRAESRYFMGTVIQGREGSREGQRTMTGCELSSSCGCWALNPLSKSESAPDHQALLFQGQGGASHSLGPPFSPSIDLYHLDPVVGMS